MGIGDLVLCRDHQRRRPSRATSPRSRSWATGRVKVYTGSSPHGQGHETAWAMLASEQLGIPMDDIEVISNDTDLVLRRRRHDGLAVPAVSRPGRARGVGVRARRVEARKLAADVLEANVPVTSSSTRSTAASMSQAAPSAVADSWGELAVAEASGQRRPPGRPQLGAGRGRPSPSGRMWRWSTSTARPAQVTLPPADRGGRCRHDHQSAPGRRASATVVWPRVRRRP